MHAVVTNELQLPKRYKREPSQSPALSVTWQGQLFEAVQSLSLFDDQKTFVDCTLYDAFEEDDVLQQYISFRNTKGFDLEKFIRERFQIPITSSQPALQVLAGDVDLERELKAYIDEGWKLLLRSFDIPEKSSLLVLKHPVVVPGGRFREMYYWDSFFTGLGLLAGGKCELFQGMVDNFANLIETYGFVPNGNRAYYLSRSQPPFFCLMVNLLEKNGIDVAKYIPLIEREYNHWMEGSENLKPGRHFKRVVGVTCRGGSGVLNCYWDDQCQPRPEAYTHDLNLAKFLPEEERGELYRNIRAAAESGWDFSTRWFADGENFETICTTDILPVDLNALLWEYETSLAKYCSGEKAAAYEQAAKRREFLIRSLFWDDEEKFYFDYNWKTRSSTNVYSLAAVVPLSVGLSHGGEAIAVAKVLASRFLRSGGLVTTWNRHEKLTGQQWDWPNGWAPLQFLAVAGLERYGCRELALEIRKRFSTRIRTGFSKWGHISEKYDMCSETEEATGGEYPCQVGFGWTNAVYLCFRDQFCDRLKSLYLDCRV